MTRPAGTAALFPSTVAILGAGSVGIYLGGRLAHAGVPVLFVGRERVRHEVGHHGLRLSDHEGFAAHHPPGAVRYATRADAIADAAPPVGLVLVTVKSAATADAARELAAALVARPGLDPLVVSFQNGLTNGDVLREALPGRPVLDGMVPFNVLARGEGRFHQGTEGRLAVADHPRLAPWKPLFARAGLPLETPTDLKPVQWAKLLLNLNNPINALCGLPLREELSQRAFRQCLALAQAEALGVMRAAGIAPAQLTPLPPAWVPHLLAVPDAVFATLGRKMLAIDPLARSSMWEDLERGRPTEIDHINGAIVRLAGQLVPPRPAPVNARLVELVRAAEAGGRRDWNGPALLAELRTTRTAL